MSSAVVSLPLPGTALDEHWWAVHEAVVNSRTYLELLVQPSDLTISTVRDTDFAYIAVQCNFEDTDKFPAWVKPHVTLCYRFNFTSYTSMYRAKHSRHHCLHPQSHPTTLC